MAKLKKYQLLSDDDLITLLRQSDIEAFNSLHDRYYGILYAHAYKRYPQREEIRDMLQELFVLIWSGRETINFNDNIAAYLYTAVRNKLLNIFKHNKVKDTYINSFNFFITNHSSTTDDDLRLKELISLVEAEVSSLPNQMRVVFNLSRKDNLSHQEIAKVLNISPLTVKKHVNNSLKILRLKLGHHFFMIFL
ncbi:MAG: RNA polymerase sigma-70 factor [Mucilaginibacter sp.]|nr:RNA polymerase sigma-70 factor [Mucilaginibacter sp.]